VRIYFKFVIIFFLLLSFVLTAFFIGLENLSFNSVDWLLGGADTSNSQNAWTFFKNDKWYFPLGKNPNYGLDIATSIIFTDSIPILGLFFKLFKSLLGENFQYFSFWIFICFFLQLFISFSILESITKNFHYSILVSILFVLSPIFLYRLGLHLALGGQWLILLAYYLNLCVDKRKLKLFWIFLIVISSYIHAYFTAMLFIMYSCHVFNEFLETKKIKKTLIDILVPLIILIFFMYLLGYFHNSIINSASIGYGVFGLDLLGIFDPSTESSNLNWSSIIKDIPGTSTEGFNYLGIGNIFLVFFALMVFSYNSLKNKKYFVNFFLRNKSYLLITIVFLCWAITSDIHFKGDLIFSLSIHKYLFGALSIFGATGRFFWPIYYLLIIFSSIYIFMYLKKNYSISLLYLIIFLQFIDIKPALNDFFVEKKHLSYFTKLEDSIWKKLPNDFEKLRTTYLYNNYGAIFLNLNHFIGTSGIKKTDITLSAGLDRSKAALARYKLTKLIHDQKNIAFDTAYIVDNLGHLRQMKYFLKNSDVGFFKRDNFWLALPNKKEEMTEEDQKRIKNIKFKKLKYNENYEFNFKNRQDFLGFGWSHNSGKKGVWTEGELAFILFDIEKNTSDKPKLYLKFQPYKGNHKQDFGLVIYFNEVEKKVINFYNNKEIREIIIDLNQQEIREENIIKFKLSNLISPFDKFESPDGRKLGILLESMIIN
tara:strand:- start:125 stop:2248 length:2124 start_codon:yes stop_codon:yes gene_type:complete